MKATSQRIGALAFCALFVVLINLSGESNDQESTAISYEDDLIRWSILDAEHCLQRMDNDLSEYINHWRALTEILPWISNREMAAKAKFLRLICLRRSLASWWKWRALPEYRSWLQLHVDHIYYIRDEDIGWFVKPDEFWKLHGEYKDLPVSDDIAWEAVNNPEPMLCETDIPCYFQELGNSVVKYLQMFPDGKYAPQALEEIISFCHRFTDVDFFRIRLREIFEANTLGTDKFQKSDKAIIRKTIENLQICLNNVAKISSDNRALKALKTSTEILEPYLTNNFQLRQPMKPAPADSVEDKEGSLRRNVDEITYTLSHEYNLDFNDLVDYWRRLNANFLFFTDLQLAARAKLAQLVCLKRAIRFGDKKNCRPPAFDKWVHEYRAYFGRRRVNPDRFWELYDENRSLPIADDIAWEAVNDFPDYDESDRLVAHDEFGLQLEELKSTMGKYLALQPGGKYAPIALERIIAFFRICLKDDPLLPPPFDAMHASRSDLRDFHKILEQISTTNKSKRAAKALSIVEAFQNVLSE